MKDKAAEKRDGGGAEERVGPSSEPEGENSTSATESTVCEEGMTGTGNAVAVSFRESYEPSLGFFADFDNREILHRRVLRLKENKLR